jgi:threonine/homoserine/homoserine lactone efflux protein
MQIFQFIGAVLLLLLTPGPTNTLIMLAGYAKGWRASAWLSGVELFGYLAVIIPVTLIAAPVAAAFPDAMLWMKILAVAWVLSLSWRLWRSAGPAAHAGDGGVARQVFITTVLNPKAPIIALAIMPQLPFLEVLPWLAVFSVSVLLAANLWLVAGSLVAKGGGALLSPRTVRKMAATGLLCFAAILAGSAVHAMT